MEKEFTKLKKSRRPSKELIWTKEDISRLAEDLGLTESQVYKWQWDRIERQ